MSNAPNDRWLWLGLGIFLFIATKQISLALIETVDLNTIHAPEETTTASTSAESTLDPKTLGVLSASPNADIARSATEILLSRFATHDSEPTEWVADLFSSSPTIRQKALSIFTLLQTRGLAPHIPEPDVLKLRGLVHRSSRFETAGARTLRSAYHAAAARKKNGLLDAWNALRRVSAVLERPMMEGVPVVLAEGMNERQVMHWARAQRRLLELGERAAREDLMFLESVKAMRRAGMVAEDEGEEETGDEGEEFDDVELDGEAEGGDGSGRDQLQDILQRIVEGDLTSGNPAVPGRTARLHEESPEEAEVRRRRREAVVVHVGGGAVGRQDIFQPQRTS
ncbi:hypothetical protein MBLNU457_7695t1 [Dothideomycetes sp. NU457]